MPPKTKTLRPPGEPASTSSAATDQARAEEDRRSPGGEARGHAEHARVVGVEDRRPALAQPRHERALLLRHAVLVAEALEVARADVRHDGYVGQRDPRERV